MITHLQMSTLLKIDQSYNSVYEFNCGVYGSILAYEDSTISNFAGRLTEVHNIVYGDTIVLCIDDFILIGADAKYIGQATISVCRDHKWNYLNSIHIKGYDIL